MSSRGSRQRLLERIDCLRELSEMYAERSAAARADYQENTGHKYARRASAIAWALDVVRAAKPELFEPDEEPEPAAPASPEVVDLMETLKQSLGMQPAQRSKVEAPGVPVGAALGTEGA